MSDNNEAVFLASGTKLNGRFVIERVIGQGGFGITYYARHEILDHAYAIKEFYISGHCSRNTSQHTVILQGMSDDMYEKYKQRFLEEAKTVLSLDHPNIVKVVDVFEENNTAYMVMPFIEGISLQKMVENNHGPLPYELTVNYMGQLSDAVAYIHSKHILHRDIKPDNVLITPDNKVMLIDFGSAREFVNDKTQRHTSILTQGYAPLEQYNSVSRKGNYTDIYALGGVYYFCLTGTTPVDATARLLETGTGDDPLKQPKDLNPNVTEAVNHTIMKAMELRPENRHQTVKEFQDDLLGRNDAKEIVDDAKEMPMKSVTETQTEKPSASPKQVKENVEDISVTNSTVEKKTKTAIADNKKPETPKKKKGKAWWVILIIMILGGAGYAIWQHQENLRMQELDMYYSCYDANSCRRYLKSYPNGRYRYEVQSSLDNFVSDSIAKVKAIQKELNAYNNCTTIAACDSYLREYPNGTYVNQVRTKKKELEKGLFSVSSTKKVYISKGNLQYQASTNTWRFAEHQWDYIGDANMYISSTNSGWIDLFGWGTSGYNGKYPYMTSNDSRDYGNGNRSISGTYYDWGVYNTISNGDGKSWRTLTIDEWAHLLYNRNTSSGIRFVRAVVNNIQGVIILPDKWDRSYYTLNRINNRDTDCYGNVISYSDWINILEANGAVFLPSAGFRDKYYSEILIYDIGKYGIYSASTVLDNDMYTLEFRENCLYIERGYREHGYSVRLVSDL